MAGDAEHPETTPIVVPIDSMERLITNSPTARSAERIAIGSKRHG